MIEGAIMYNHFNDSSCFSKECSHILLRGKRIPSLADLVDWVHEYCEDPSKVHLTFYECSFDNVNLINRVVKCGITISHSAVSSNPWSFQNMVFEENFSIGHSFAVSPSFIGCLFAKGFSLTGTVCHGRTGFTSINFVGEANFSWTIFYGPSEYTQVHFHAPSSFSHAAAHMYVQFCADGRLIDFRQFEIERYGSESWCDRVQNELEKKLDKWSIDPKNFFVQIRQTPRDLRKEAKPNRTWNEAKSIAENPALAKASILSLLLIPVVAAVWNAMHDYLALSAAMPLSLAIAYISSLLAFVGLSVYKSYCPKIVQEYDLKEYVSSEFSVDKLSDRTHSSDLRRAIGILSERTNSRGSLFLTHNHETVWLPELEQIHLFSDIDEDNFYKDRTKANLKSTTTDPKEVVGYVTAAERKRVAIEEAAKVHYSEIDHSRPIPLKISLLVYKSALFLIIVVAALQLFSVVDATGII